MVLPKVLIFLVVKALDHLNSLACHTIMISFTIDMLGWTPNKGVTNQRPGKLDKLSQNAQAQTGYPRVQIKYALHKRDCKNPNPQTS